MLGQLGDALRSVRVKADELVAAMNAQLHDVTTSRGSGSGCAGGCATTSRARRAERSAFSRNRWGRCWPTNAPSCEKCSTA